MGLGLQPAAGSDPVQVTTDTELQQISWCIAGAASILRLNTSEPRHGEIQPFDKGLDEAHRVLRANIVAQRFQ